MVAARCVAHERALCDLVSSTKPDPLEDDDPSGRAKPRRRMAAGFALVGLVVALGVGIYAFVQELDKSSTTKAMGTFCNSVGLVMQLAYDHRGGLGTFHKVVDKDANAVGGRVRSDTRAFELALSRRDTATAQKYLLRLDELCSSEGSPISTPVTTSPAPGNRAPGK
jgi:hypothetical protein